MTETLPSLASRYRELRADLDAVRDAMHTLSLSDPISDSDLAELIGWKTETVAKWRHPSTPREPKTPRVSRADTALPLIPDEWTPARTLRTDLSKALGLAPSYISDVLSKLEKAGKIEARYGTQKYMGHRVRSHYRRITDTGLGLAQFFGE